PLRWTGVRLPDVLELAGPGRGAEWVRVSSGEYAASLSREEARAAILAERLNGEPLGVEHGGPWRLVVPSASCFTSVKWVDRLEVAAEPGEASGERIARARLNRDYDEPGPRDGRRVLVDRVWPRGLSKEDAHIDEWLRELGPSTELRKWFGHDLARWEEFRRRYRAELNEPQQRERLQHLRELAGRQQVSLLFGAKDREHNQAVVIAELLRSTAVVNSHAHLA